MRCAQLAAVVDTKVEALRVAAAAAAGPSSSHRRGEVERPVLHGQERLNEEVAAAEDASKQPAGR